MATNIRRRVASVPAAPLPGNDRDENCSPKAAAVVSSHGAINGKVAAVATAGGGCTRRVLASIGNGVGASHRRGVASQDCALPKHSPSLAAAAAPFAIYEEAEVQAEVAAAPSASTNVSLEPRGHEATTDLEVVLEIALSLPASSNTSAASPMILDSPWATGGNCICRDMCGVEVNKETVHDPLVLSEYSVHIYIYMCKAESRYRPRANYMSRQQDMSHPMRAVLVDWLSEVVSQYGLQRETLHLAVGYSDRFLSRMSVTRDKLQLLGAAALYVAAKYEEIYPPDAHDFAYTTADTYSVRQVLRMEQLLLRILSFDLAAPTFTQFLRFYAQSLSTPAQVVSLAMYLGELTLLDGQRYLSIVPSILSAAALGLASLISGHEWPLALEELTGYSFEILQPCVSALHITHTGKQKMHSAFKTYQSPRNYSVALMEPVSDCPWLCSALESS
ncbi:cyclin-A2-like isoform X1 [Petromyzon marinus]|uniref:cyclin-A2-like isoform X1 n=1 Tax=Petromyzon marinus TaxID=7757 RepID=UPI003F7197AE